MEFPNLLRKRKRRNTNARVGSSNMARAPTSQESRSANKDPKLILQLVAPAILTQLTMPMILQATNLPKKRKKRHNASNKTTNQSASPRAQSQALTVPMIGPKKRKRTA